MRSDDDFEKRLPSFWTAPSKFSSLLKGIDSKVVMTGLEVGFIKQKEFMQL